MAFPPTHPQQGLWRECPSRVPCVAPRGPHPWRQTREAFRATPAWWDGGWASSGRPSGLSIRQQVCVLFPFSPSPPGNSGTLCAQPGEQMPLGGAFWASVLSPRQFQAAPSHSVLTSPRLLVRLHMGNPHVVPLEQQREGKACPLLSPAAGAGSTRLELRLREGRQLRKPQAAGAAAQPRLQRTRLSF